MNMSAKNKSGTKNKRYRPYPAYKDSGVEWLGEIPEHWELKRLKFIVKEPLMYGANEAAELEDPDLPRYIRITDIMDDGTLREETFKSLPEKIATPYILKEGDLLFARSGATVGKTFLYNSSWGRAAHAGYLIRARVNQSLIDSQFMYYFTQSAVYWDWLRTNFIQATIQNVSAERYASLIVPVPPKDEQKLIIKQIKKITTKINTLIDKKEQIIKLLQEKRTALITQAVTKGLDSTVPMKDSGVEWLGEVPAHWKVLKIKRLTMVKRGASPRPIDDPKYFDDEGEYAWVRIADVTASNRYLETTTQRLSPLGMSLSVKPHPGDLFLSIAGSVGKPIITKIKCCIHDGFVYFPHYKGNPEFLYYIFASEQPYGGLGKLGTQLNLNTDTVGDIYIGYPPDQEQEDIIYFLDQETAKIDALVAKIQEAIDRLKEYRTAVISAAVTGKIDVRDAVQNKRQS